MEKTNYRCRENHVSAVQGHSLAMLNRIAAALDRRVEINFVPISRARSA